MIWSPCPGQRVRLHYAARRGLTFPHEGATGTVVRASRGPGPRNAQVQLDTGLTVIVPRGNLERIEA